MSSEDLLVPALVDGSDPHFPGYSSEFNGFEPIGRLGGQMPDETLTSLSPHRGHSFLSSLLSLHSGPLGSGRWLFVRVSKTMPLHPE